MPGSTQRWTEKRAWTGTVSIHGIVGLIYIPAYAINYTAMWDKTSFDPAAIDKELALASASGMNVLRAVLQFAVYEDDRLFLKTLDAFMAVCEKHKLNLCLRCLMIVFFGINHDPKVGVQPEPLKDGMHGHGRQVPGIAWSLMGKLIRGLKNM